MTSCAHRRQATIALAAAGILAASSAPAADRAAADQVVARGAALAHRHCAACHVVSVASRYNGIGSSPSFFLFAEQPARYEPRLLVFQTLLPHPSRAIDLTPADIKAIIAYIRTLERPPPPRSGSRPVR